MATFKAHTLSKEKYINIHTDISYVKIHNRKYTAYTMRKRHELFMW